MGNHVRRFVQPTGSDGDGDRHGSGNENAPIVGGPRLTGSNFLPLETYGQKAQPVEHALNTETPRQEAHGNIHTIVAR